MQTMYFNKLRQGDFNLSRKKDQYILGIWFSRSLRLACVILGIFILATTGFALLSVGKISIALTAYLVAWASEDFFRTQVRHVPPQAKVNEVVHGRVDLCQQPM